MRLKIASAIVIFAVILGVFMTGCTSSNTQSGASNDSVSVSAKAVQSPQQFTSSSGLSIQPASGNKFVMYDVTFANKNAQSRQVQAAMFTVQDTSGKTYTVATNSDQPGMVSNPFPAAFTMTQPGTTLSGVIVYEVPQNAKLVNMTYDDHSANYGTYSHIVIQI